METDDVYELLGELLAGQDGDAAFQNEKQLLTGLYLQQDRRLKELRAREKEHDEREQRVLGAYCSHLSPSLRSRAASPSSVLSSPRRAASPSHVEMRRNNHTSWSPPVEMRRNNHTSWSPPVESLGRFRRTAGFSMDERTSRTHTQGPAGSPSGRVRIQLDASRRRLIGSRSNAVDRVGVDIYKLEDGHEERVISAKCAMYDAEKSFQQAVARAGMDLEAAEADADSAFPPLSPVSYGSSSRGNSPSSAGFGQVPALSPSWLRTAFADHGGTAHASSQSHLDARPLSSPVRLPQPLDVREPQLSRKLAAMVDRRSGGGARLRSRGAGQDLFHELDADDDGAALPRSASPMAGSQRHLALSLEMPAALRYTTSAAAPPRARVPSPPARKW